MEFKTETDDKLSQRLCSACLCVDRSMYKITEPKLVQFYMDILDEMPLSKTTTGPFRVCYVCRTMLNKCLEFKEQVKGCHRILNTYIYKSLTEYDILHISRPPRLTVRKRYTINILPEEFDNDSFADPLVCVKDEMENDIVCVKDGNIVGMPLDNTDNLLVYETDIQNTARRKEKTSDKTLTDSCQPHISSTLKDDGNDVPNIWRDDFDDEDRYIDDPLVSVKEELQNKQGITDELVYNGRKKQPKIRNTMRRKERKAQKLSKRLKVKEERSTKNSTKNKIVTIEMTYEEMLMERMSESKQEGFVKSEFKCDTCIIGFEDSKTHEKHVAAKHSANLGDYSCPICKTVVPSVEAFTTHYKRHLKRYECSLCKQRTLDLKTMKQHFHTSHDITLKEYKCNLCGTVSNSIDTHRYHKQSHKPRVQCPRCDKTFSHRAGLMNHRMTVHESRNKFPCTICDKVFRWKTSLRRHVDTHNKAASSPPAYCVTCGVSFASVCSYQRHLKNSLKHITPDQLRYICDHCKRRFSDKTKLRDHIEEKHLHKTYQCQICLKPSKNRVSLDQHIRNLHRGRPHDKMCQHCGKGFPTKGQLESHVRSHTGERPFICELCPTAFSQQSNLHKHNRQVHLNIKSKRYPASRKRKEDPPVSTVDPLPGAQHPAPSVDPYYMYNG